MDSDIEPRLAPCSYAIIPTCMLHLCCSCSPGRAHASPHTRHRSVHPFDACTAGFAATCTFAGAAFGGATILAGALTGFAALTTFLAGFFAGFFAGAFFAPPFFAAAFFGATLFAAFFAIAMVAAA